MVVKNDDITIRHATGLELQEATLPLDDFRPMTEEEIFPSERDPSGITYRGFTTKDGEGAQIIFTVKPKLRDFNVFIRRGEMADMLAPTILWSRRRFLHVLFLKAVFAFHSLRTKGGVPRLAYNGRTKRNRES